MAGFFRRMVDKMAGYPDDVESDYESEYDDVRDEDYSSNPSYDSRDYDRDYNNMDYGQEDYNRNYQQRSYKKAFDQQSFGDPRVADEYETQYSAPASNNNWRPTREGNPSKVVSLNNSSEQQLIILSPNNIQTAQKVCDHIRAGHTVICNIENTDPKVAQRVIDFITGSAYAMDGNVKPIDTRAYTFVAVPRSVHLVDKEVVEERVEVAAPVSNNSNFNPQYQSNQNYNPNFNNNSATGYGFNESYRMGMAR